MNPLEKIPRAAIGRKSYMYLRENYQIEELKR